MLGLVGRRGLLGLGGFLLVILLLVGVPIMRSQVEQNDVWFVVSGNTLMLGSSPVDCAVYRNGLRMKLGVDYSRNKAQITFLQPIGKDDTFVVDIR